MVSKSATFGVLTAALLLLVAGGFVNIPMPHPASPAGSIESHGGVHAHEPPDSASLDLTKRTALEAAWKAWNFTGMNGSLTVESDDLTVFDVAFPVTDAVNPDSVRLNVTYTYENRSAVPDGALRWVCIYSGARGDNDAVPAVGHSWVYCLFDRYDGTHETMVEVGGRRVIEVSREAWYCQADLYACSIDGAFTVTETWFGSDWLRWVRGTADTWDWDRPVVHMLVVVGGLEPDHSRLTASWNDTWVGVSATAFDSTFTYFRDDFDSVAHVSHETGFGLNGQVQAGAVLEPTIGGPGESVLFYYRPGGFGLGYVDGVDYQAGYVRPDDYRQGVDYGFELDLSNVTGTYRFWYNVSVDRFQDEPVLMGSTVDWYTFPWESELPWVSDPDPR